MTGKALERFNVRVYVLLLALRTNKKHYETYELECVAPDAHPW